MTYTKVRLADRNCYQRGVKEKGNPKMVPFNIVYQSVAY